MTKVNHNAWNYCYNLTKKGAVVPITEETVKNLLEMFKEYTETVEQMYSVGGGFMTCERLLELASLSHEHEQSLAVVEVLQEKFAGLRKELDEILVI
jgi:hypothetical protein